MLFINCSKDLLIIIYQVLTRYNEQDSVFQGYGTIGTGNDTDEVNFNQTMGQDKDGLNYKNVRRK